MGKLTRVSAMVGPVTMRLFYLSVYGRSCDLIIRRSCMKGMRASMDFHKDVATVCHQQGAPKFAC